MEPSGKDGRGGGLALARDRSPDARRAIDDGLPSAQRASRRPRPTGMPSCPGAAAARRVFMRQAADAAMAGTHQRPLYRLARIRQYTLFSTCANGAICN
jgi:hypothetical protein